MANENETEKMVQTLVDSVKMMIEKLVDHPDDIDLTPSTSTKTVIIQINVNKNDFGKIIGKKGRTIESLKVLALAIKKTNYPDDSRNVSLEILED